MDEIEVKFFEIDKAAVEEKLKSLGAKYVGKFTHKLKPFDFPDMRLDKERHAWIRLRDQGDKITLSYKQRIVGAEPLKDAGMKEIEVEVSNFDDTAKILEEIGMVHKGYQEKIRTRYVLDEIECDIDEWPLIRPYIELEGESLEKIKLVSDKLGFNWNEHKVCSASQALKHYGVDFTDYSILTHKEQIKK